MRRAGAGLVAALTLLCTTLVVSARHTRRLCLLLALVLAGFTFESGRHTAHHIGQAPCPVAAVVSQLAGAVDDASAVEAAPAPVWEPVTLPPIGATPARALAPDAGRAPPVHPAA